MGNLCFKGQAFDKSGKGGRGASDDLPDHRGETVSVDDSKVSVVSLKLVR